MNRIAPGYRPRRRAPGTVAVGAVVLTGVLSAVGVAVGVKLGLLSDGATTTPRATVSVVGTAVPTKQPEGSALISLVAQVQRQFIVVYRRPDAGTFSQLLYNPNAEGAQLVFLVNARRGDWLRVYLPTRPNFSTGWIRASEVKVVGDSYRVKVNLPEHRLTVWRQARVVLRQPVGVGRAVTPTPGGRYFITELLAQPNPHGFYGPYAFGLSAHSDVLNEFRGADGEIGIHGTDLPSGIGTDVSHGCIRIANPAITRLAHLLPLGTPVTIVH